MDPKDALDFACAAGALAATRAGAQPSLPTRDEVEGLLKG
jgi:ribokinase